MSDQSVELQMTATQKGILEILDKMNRNTDSLARKMDKVEKASRKGAAAGKSGFDQATASVGQFLSQVSGIGSALSAAFAVVTAIKAEVESMKRRQEAAAFQGLTFSESVRRVRINFQEDATLKDADLESTLLGLADKTRTDPNIVAAAASNAFSAKGSLDNQTALNAIEESLRLLPGDLQSSVELSGRALDVAKISGVTDFQQILGFLMNVQANARVTDIASVGAYGVPAINSLSQVAGDSIEQAAEVFATINQLMQDVEGRTSSTAAIALGEQLASFNPDEKGKDAFGEFAIPQQQRDAFAQAGNTQERLAVMQQSPELRRQFMADSSFEKKATGAVTALLTGDAKATTEMASARANIGAISAAQAPKFEAKVAQLEGGEFQPLATAQQQAATNKANRELADPVEARTGVARKILTETLAGTDAVGLDMFLDRFASAGFEAGTMGGQSPEFAAAIALLDQIDGMSQQDASLVREQVVVLKKLADTYDAREQATATKEGREPVDSAPWEKLARSFNGLDDLKKALTENTAAINRQSGQPAAGGAAVIPGSAPNIKVDVQVNQPANVKASTQGRPTAALSRGGR